MAAVLAMVLPASAASAAPDESESAKAMSKQAAESALLSFVAQHSPASVAAGNYIGNFWGGGLGVIRVRDGNYTYGTHDAVLPSGKWTDLDLGWSNAAGWYTGAGHCTVQWRSDGGGPWYRQLPDLGPGQHFIGQQTSYFVDVYDC
ncbi:hypothetical protein ACQP0U_21480 [Micromonospora sp. CA-269861]|uniref:hypothetical protein n=1 Tax=Micromonospora sp. CA-269861 TaxID=3239968 RepID=UPI003D8CAE20